jgi:hypothetical protein
MTKKQIKNLILKIYKKREVAYDTLLECDMAIDKLINYFYDDQTIQRSTRKKL